MNNELPLVCICVPTYNVAITVRETLESILAQTYPRLVVHVSDNASTDETVKIVEAIADPRMTIHRHADNIGGEGNFNRCIQLAEGKYTAIFHADDIYEPDMVAAQVAFLEGHPEAGAVFAEAALIDEAGEKWGALCLPSDVRSCNGLHTFEALFKSVLRNSNFFICPSAMVRTQVYQQEIKYWRGDLFKSSADLDVWLRILQQHRIGFLPRRLIQYRMSDAQFSANLRARTTRSDLFRVLEYYLGQTDVQLMLSAQDLNNYRSLERADQIVRAVNLYLQGRVQEADILSHDVLSSDAIWAAVQGRRGMMTLVAGILLRIFLFFNIPVIGKAVLLRSKRLARR